MSMKRGNKLAIITGAIIVLIVGFSYTALQLSAMSQKTAVAPATTLQLANPPTVARLFELVNAERDKVGVAPLIIDERLNQSAQFKADDMYNNNYFDHIDANGKHGYTYVYQYAGDICKTASENIVWGRSINTAEEDIRWWIGSEAHYEAMINPNYTYTGFGISGAKVVEHFCIAK